MDKGYEKERFDSLSIKTSVAKKFNGFCRKMSLSKSMTLLVMIAFFEEKWNFTTRIHRSKNADARGFN
ncbi:BfmA/BtgA family mobilization protein [Lacinutrix algicola]|uniref:BfmA/BtgA family mobilization protein n=1 Tax=Lacinutrix algicola TaxID=342954 RepID=UPI0023B78FA6|nr:BfmA/BtgA family mobilization protein [Lacinutrix algicola]